MRNALKWVGIVFLPVLILSFISFPHEAVAATAPNALQHLGPVLFVGAIGKASDMVIYQEEFQAGMVEKIGQYLGVFNAGSRGAIQLVPNILKGDYKKEAFFKDVANIVSRRDSTSTADVTDLALTQGENIGIKLDRKVGPVAQALNAMRKAGLTEESASRAFGEIAAKRKVKDMVNAAVIAVEAAISGTASLNLDITGETNKNISVAALNRALLPFGDDAQGIVIWLAHSKINNDLVGSLIASSVTGLADVASLQGSVPQWLGRPALITDAPALWDLNGSLVDTYNTLGLTEGAVLVEESEEESFVTEIVTGKEQLARRWQSEHAFTVSIKGYKWNTVTGTNPTDAALGTSSNWIRTYSDDKALAGVRLVTR